MSRRCTSLVLVSKAKPDIDRFESPTSFDPDCDGREDNGQEAEKEVATGHDRGCMGKADMLRSNVWD